MKNDKEWLSRVECNALRGLAILGIMLHNYCHWLSMAVKENEYTFSARNNARMWYELTHPTEYLPVHLVSFLGHYGVPVFLFLSGFGLVMKYEKASPLSATPSTLHFVRYNYLKLFRMMVIGYVAFVLVDYMTPRPHHYALLDVVGQLLMFNNLLDTPDKVIWPGPFWFFGLMMQLYVVYRLLLYRRHWALAVALIALCWAVQLPYLDDAETLNRLRYNCISGMLPFCLGLLVGRLRVPDAYAALPRYCWPLILLVASALVFVLCLTPQLWLWVPVAIIIGGVALVKSLPATVLNWLVWTGGISAAMFVAHPTLRKVLIPISLRGDLYAGLLLYIVATFVVSWLFMMIINKMSKPRL